VTKPVTVRSANGAGLTVIAGHAGIGDSAVRCVYLTNGAALVGFTLTNGATRYNANYPIDFSGGGVWCESASAVVSNCVLTGNSAWGAGGGSCGGTLNDCTLTGNSANRGGGGSCGGTLNNCLLSLNWAVESDGGGAYGGTLNNCVLGGNFANIDHGGGGAVGSTLNNCTLTGNAAGHGGGARSGVLNSGVRSGNRAIDTGGGGASFGTLNNCTLTGNSARVDGGGANGGTLNNCTLSGNSADHGGGADGCTMNNCTVSGNSANFTGGGASGGTLNNCIVYYNTAASGGANYYGPTLNYCCTTPPPPGGPGNFTNAPLFLDQAGGNLRLQSNSPCINAGLNAYAPAGLDLDGHPRIVGGTVDVGAYEFPSPNSLISYAWLQQYGLPTDGSADYADPDGDGLNNWQEWRAGTDPTNPLSVLRLMKPVPRPSGIAVRWLSVSNRAYLLERSTNLGVAPLFLPLSSNIVGQAGSTTLLDTNVAGVGPVFYRVGVQE